MARSTPKSPSPEALVWFTFKVRRKIWTVFLVSRETVQKHFPKPDYAKPTDFVVGGCWYRRSWILLDASLPLRVLKRACFHEQIHACHGDPGRDGLLLHELFVEKIEVTLLRALAEACGLRFPPLPHAWQAMRRRLAKNATQVEC